MSISDEQVAGWRKDAERMDNIEWEGNYHGRVVVLALLAEVDTLRERLTTAGDLGTEYANDYADAIERAELAETALRDMEIERNMLRITTGELTAALEAGDACGAVGCRAMERLAKVESLADEWESGRIYLRGLGFRALEYGDEFAADLRAALSTERGEGRG